MHTVADATKPTSWGKRLRRGLWVTSVSLLVLYAGARLAWRFSGSNKWEFVEERKGVKVYSLKSPGSDLQKFKGIGRVRTTLPRLVKLFQDAEICKEAGCTSTRLVDRVDDQQQFYAFQHTLPFPFRKREFVVREQFYQDPRTKAILMEVVAAQDKIPEDSCCFRVTEMNNTWLFTPVTNGEIEIELILNMHEGGFVPDLMLNRMRDGILVNMLSHIQGWVDRDKYRDAKYDFIDEGRALTPETARADVPPAASTTPLPFRRP